MSDLCLLAASLVAHGHLSEWTVGMPIAKLPGDLPNAIDASLSWLYESSLKAVREAIPTAMAEVGRPEFSHSRFDLVKQVAHLKKSDVQTANPADLQTFDLQTFRAQNAVAYSAAFTPATSSATSTETTTPIASFRPATGGQLYRQRLIALRVGKTYTRLESNSFQEEWTNAADQPNYRQWVDLLQQEARAMSRGQGSSRLSVLMGDSLSLWFPPELLSKDRFWLNQGISGDTTTGVLNRVALIDAVQPDVIHVLAGINDMRRGATDAEIVNNLQQIIRQLKQAHPQTRIIIHSILPTRLASLPIERIRRLNYSIASLTKQEGAFFLNLQPAFADETGLLRRDLTTDGIHLSVKGYQVWQSVIASIL